jgi:hypothetical protein
MKLRTPVTLLTLVTGIGAVAGGAAYAVTAAGSAAPITLAASTSAQPVATSTAAPVPQRDCDDGAWIGPNGINVQGRPAGFDRGDDGAAYVWHGADGWHLRTTDVQNVAHHYTGTITVSPGASVAALRPVKLDPGDKVWLTSDNVIHYDLTTYAGVDGFDFAVTACDSSREHEALRFSMDFDGREQDTSRIKLGREKAHPPAATFDVHRSV